MDPHPKGTIVRLTDAPGIALNHPKLVGARGVVTQMAGDLYDNGEHWYELRMLDTVGCDRILYAMHKEVEATGFKLVPLEEANVPDYIKQELRLH